MGADGQYNTTMATLCSSVSFHDKHVTHLENEYSFHFWFVNNRHYWLIIIKVKFLLLCHTSFHPLIQIFFELSKVQQRILSERPDRIHNFWISFVRWRKKEYMQSLGYVNDKYNYIETIGWTKTTRVNENPWKLSNRTVALIWSNNFS